MEELSDLRGLPVKPLLLQPPVHLQETPNLAITTSLLTMTRRTDPPDRHRAAAEETLDALCNSDITA